MDSKPAIREPRGHNSLHCKCWMMEVTLSIPHTAHFENEFFKLILVWVFGVGYRSELRWSGAPWYREFHSLDLRFRAYEALLHIPLNYTLRRFWECTMWLLSIIIPILVSFERLEHHLTDQFRHYCFFLI